MSKVLKITRPDKSVHVIPMENKAFWLGYNKRMPESARVKMEEINEKEAQDLPYIDENFVTGAAAIDKLSEKDKEIAELKALLKKATNNGSQKDDKGKTAEEVIALIKEAKSIEEVENLSKGDERKTVQDAALKTIEALKAS